MAPAYLEEDLIRRDSIIPGSAGHLTDACHINTTKLQSVRLRRHIKQQRTLREYISMQTGKYS